LVLLECTISLKNPNIEYNYAPKKEIENIIKYLKPTNSLGRDVISVKILKATFHLISSPVTYMCNKLL